MKALKQDVKEHETSFDNSGWNLIEEHNYSPHHPQSTADMASITEQRTTVKIKVSDLLRKIDSIEVNKKSHLNEAEKYARSNDELERNLCDPGTVRGITAPIEQDIHAVKKELSELQSIQDVTNDVVKPSLHAVESSAQWILGNAKKNAPRYNLLGVFTQRIFNPLANPFAHGWQKLSALLCSSPELDYVSKAQEHSRNFSVFVTTLNGVPL